MARELGFASATEFLRRVTSREITEWRAFFRIEAEDWEERRQEQELENKAGAALAAAKKRGRR